MSNDHATLREIYELLDKLESSIDKKLERLEQRILLLESAIGKITGVAIVLSSVFGVAVSWAWGKIFN